MELSRATWKRSPSGGLYVRTATSYPNFWRQSIRDRDDIIEMKEVADKADSQIVYLNDGPHKEHYLFSVHPFYLVWGDRVSNAQ